MSLARLARRAIPLRWQPAARFYYERWRGLEERELDMVCRAIRPGDRVADIGANHGVYTYAFARRGASVEAFEPQAECAGILGCFAGTTHGIRVHQVALGASAGTGRVASVGAGRGAETRIQPADAAGGAISVDGPAVPMAALDDLDLPPFALLKIDVEGGEADVLRGARRTLERDRPLIFVEIEQRHLSRPISEVFQFIESLGYAIEFMDRSGLLRPIPEFDLRRDQDVGALETGDGVYINNFFLSHPSGDRRWSQSARAR